MFQEFPYTDMHQLNLDWIIKIAKDFLDQYTHIQQLIEDGEQSIQDLTADGLNQLDEKAEALQALLDAWYEEHSDDIAQQLADALSDISDTLTSSISTFNANAAAELTTFETLAMEKIQELLQTIPSDYPTDLQNTLNAMNTNFQNIADNKAILVTGYNQYVDLSGTTIQMENNVPKPADTSAGYNYSAVPCSAGDVFTINGHGGSQTRLWGFTDSVGNILDKSAASLTQYNKVIVAPTNAAWLIIHTNTTDVSCYGIYIKTKVQRNTDDIKMYNSYDILPEFATYNKIIANGITFTWNEDHSKCYIVGTSTGISRNNLLLYTAPLPDQLVPNTNVYIDITHKPTSAYIQIISINSSSEKKYTDITHSQYYHIDSDVTGITISIYVPSGVTIDDYISFGFINESATYKQLSPELLDIKNTLHEYLPYNVLTEFGSFHSETQNGITYTWNENHTQCLVNGATNANTPSFNALWLYTAGLPEELEPGKTYELIYKNYNAENTNVIFQIIYKDVDGGVTYNTYTAGTTFTIPEDTVGITCRLYVAQNTSISNNLLNVEIRTVSKAIEANNTNLKLYGVGSSFLRGSIWPNGVYSHLSAYGDSPFGILATSLNIPQSNVEFILKSSTGLLYDAGNGNILNTILNTDISKYDYILTQVNRPDMGVETDGYPIGTMSSTAGDGSIAGAVLTLLNYMHSDSPTATLILVSAPPSDPRTNYSYDKVFTGVYRNGSSIHDLDVLMHQMAAKYNFIYIDWERLNISYYYRDFCYSSNLHSETDNVPRAMGAYLARMCKYE